MDIILTGDRPTGPLHLGHFVGSLSNRVQLQSTYQQYIMVADVQALTDYFDQPEKIRANIHEVVKDYLSVGINPQLSTIFIQSHIPAIAELTVFYLNLVTVARLMRNPTVKAEIQQKGFEESLPAGFLCYPVSQTADITILKATHVPVGEDQLPMLEQCNEIVRRFNYTYQTDYLVECKPIIGTTGRLVGIDGKAKASKSLGNAIFLSDSKEVVQQKVMAMYTDPNHLKVTDKGQVEGNVVFSYLDAFYPNQEQVQEWKAHYQRGGLGDMTLKRALNDCLQAFLDPIRERRASLNDSMVKDILQQGTVSVNNLASNHLSAIKSIMGVYRF